MKTKEYVELVHLDPRTLFNPRFNGISKRVSELDRIIGVHYFSGDLDKNFPPVSKNTPSGWVELFGKSAFTNVQKSLEKKAIEKLCLTEKSQFLL